MKSVSRDIKHVQKKVIQSIRKSDSIELRAPKKGPSLLGGEGKWGEAIRNRRSGRRRRM